VDEPTIGVKPWNLIPLMPEFIEAEHAGYARAIIAALDDPTIHNIALSGNYGVGKSSILQRVSALKKDKVVELSLSTLAPIQASNLDGSVPVQATTPTNRIQQEIVKQLLYREDPDKAPGSRFRRIERFKWKREITLAFLLGVVITTVFMIAGWASTMATVLSSVWDPELWIYPIILALVTAGAFLVGRMLHGRLQIKQFSAGPAAVTLDEKSVSYFDQYLDEIVYFFESSDRDIVIFEDIDRFNDSHIFETLRSLNTLLNASPQIQKPVRFIYAIKDSIFDRIGLEQEGRKADSASVDIVDPAQAESVRANRTKFFDLVIPVVPFITHRSARNLTSQVLRGIQHDVADDLIDLAGRFVPDMRLLKNVRNEFVVFRDRIFSGDGEKLALSETDLFAMMLYKSTHLSDFEVIRLGKSKLDRLYEISRVLVADNIRRVERELRAARLDISRAATASDRSKRLGKLLVARIDMMVRAAGFRHQNGQYLYAGVSKPEADFATVAFWRDFANSDPASTVGWSNPYYGGNLTLQRSDVAALVGDNVDAAAWEESDQEEAMEKVRELQAQLVFLRTAEVGELMKRPEFLVDHEDRALSLDAVAQKLLTKGLAYSLVRAGYIDRNFTLYTSTFHGDRVSPAATNFIIHHVERGLMDEHFALDASDVEAVVRERGIEALAEPALYNIAILDHLLEDENPAADVMIAALARLEPDGRRFIQSYVAGGMQAQRLVAKLTALSPRVLGYLVSDVELDDEARLALVSSCLQNLTRDTKQRVGEASKTYLAQNYAHIPAVTEDLVRPNAVQLLAQLFRDAGIVLAELQPVSKSTRSAFVELGLYELTLDNLRTALGEGAGLALDEIRRISPDHVYPKVLAELPAYLAAIEGRSPSNLSVEDFAVVLSEVHESAPSMVDQVIATASGNSRVDIITNVPVDTWEALARGTRFPASYENVAQYVNHVGSVDEALAVLLTARGEIIDLDGVEEADKRALAIALISAAGVLTPEVRAKLAESLNLRNYIAARELPAENGELFAQLISRRVIAGNAATYEYLAGADWRTRERVLGVSLTFPDWVTPELLGVDIGPVLASAAVTDSAKRIIVERADQYAPLGGPAGLLEIARLAQTYSIPVGYLVVEQMASNRVPSASVVALLQPYFTSATDSELMSVLRLVGDAYAQLTSVGRDKPKIPNSAPNRALLEELTRRGIVASFDPSQNPIKVNKRYK
jgi:hypothetical protein